MEEDKTQFQKDLESGVIGNTSTDKMQALLEQKEQMLRDLESNVVKDPDAITKLKKDIKKIEKAIEEGKLEAEVEPEEKESIEDLEKKEKSQEEEEKNKEENEEEKEPDKQDASTVISYEDAALKLHEFRMAMYKDQKSKGQLVSSRDAFIMELELEKKKAELLKDGKQDEETLATFGAKDEEYRQEEQREKEPIQREIRERSRKYAEYMVALYNINLEIQYIHTLMRDGKISPEDYESRKEIALNEKVRLNKKIAELNPEELMKAMEEENLRKGEKAKVLGIEYEDQRQNIQSDEARASEEYQKQKEYKQQGNLNFAEKTGQENLEQSIEERRDHLEKLKKKLEDLPNDNIKDRYNILKEMETENIQLESEQKMQDRKSRGEEIDSKEEAKETATVQKEVEEAEEQNIKDYKETEEAIKSGEKIAGEQAVASPEQATKTEDEKAREIIGTAVVAGAITDRGSAPIEKAANVYIAHEVVAPSQIPGLEKQVNRPDDPEGAKAIVENAKEVEQAKEELAKNEKAVMKEVKI